MSIKKSRLLSSSARSTLSFIFKRNRKINALLLVILVAGFAFAFQNCGADPVQGLSLQDQAAGLNVVYSGNFDQIAYMSCSNMPPGSFDTSAFFTFRAGSYFSGGMTLSPWFIQKYGTMSANNQASMLQISPVNSSATAQLSLRSLGDMQSVFASNGSTAQENLDYWNFFSNLGSLSAITDMISRLSAKEKQVVQVGDSLQQNRFEADLHFEGNSVLSNNVRTQLASNTFVLGLTFSGGGAAGGVNSSTEALSPADIVSSGTTGPDYVLGQTTTNSVYGMGYTVSFRLPQGQPSSSYGNWTLSNIQESSLQSMSGQNLGLSGWTCPTGSPYNLQFRIVRANDAASVGCNTQPDPYPLTPELQVIRRSLRVEDWYVDTINNCIVPKKSGYDCYGATTGTIPSVNYNITQSCGNGGTSLPCVQFASICYRNQ